MTKKRLESYISMKEEISELRDKLEHLAEDTTDNSVINDYRSGFPIPQSVVGVDQHSYWRYHKRYTEQIKELEKQCAEVEEYIENIQDSLTRRIFRMTFIDGYTQQTVGKILHTERSNISKKINRFLKENS